MNKKKKNQNPKNQSKKKNKNPKEGKRRKQTFGGYR